MAVCQSSSESDDGSEHNQEHSIRHIPSLRAIDQDENYAANDSVTASGAGARDVGASPMAAAEMGT